MFFLVFSSMTLAEALVHMVRLTAAKMFLAVLMCLATLTASCAALTEGKFVTKEGKESPFKPQVDSNAPPRDPTERY